MRWNTGKALDLLDLSRYFAGLLVVLGLLFGVLIVIRKGWLPTGIAGFSTINREDRRLTVSESLILDPRRRVVIVRCDDREHAVLLGPERETVLDSFAALERAVFEPDFSNQNLGNQGDGASEERAEAPTDETMPGQVS